MHSVGFYSAAVVAALAVSSAQAHMHHHHAQAHAMRGLQMSDGSMGMDMTSASSTASASTSAMDMTSSTDSDSTMDMTSSMSMSMDMTSSSTADGEYTCPVCGMSTTDNGYDNENHVGMVNGQTVYTCGMAARSFDDYDFEVTDTAYLAANMAEFIVNSTDADAFAECTDSCDECADGISDPVTGDEVTTSNYEYVCLTNGQKIYFASTDSKNEYLSNVNSEPRYLVNSVICEGETCSDAENITTLSAAAQAFVADLSSSSDSGSATITASGSGSSAASGVQMPAGVTLAVAGVLAAITAIAA